MAVTERQGCRQITLHNTLKKLGFLRGGKPHHSLPGLGARPAGNNVMLAKPSRNRWLAATRVDFRATSMTKGRQGGDRDDPTDQDGNAGDGFYPVYPATR
ncbi:hypothetical protein [Mesorhizobium sp. IMUNJ 23232]|uniref:hypothetical protein n=1 Tax=Mesorhizobium sp. IMUNJ 23232 TaxID=3376064 RepID=UPI0037C835D3